MTAYPKAADWYAGTSQRFRDTATAAGGAPGAGGRWGAELVIGPRDRSVRGELRFVETVS
jgi:hypothetical protein